MKKLFLKSGVSLDVCLLEDKEGRKIEVYNETGLYYIVLKGIQPMDQVLILGSHRHVIPLWETVFVAEIYQNFDQYWNNLNQ